MIKHYVVMGDPIALARARQTKGRFYDTQKNTKLVWGIHLERQHAKAPMFRGPVFMDVIFYMRIPTSRSVKKIEQLSDQWHILRPDLDNLTKFIFDAATNICYKDDCIIAKLSVEKVYDDGKGPRTEFILKELQDERYHRDLNG